MSDSFTARLPVELRSSTPNSWPCESRGYRLWLRVKPRGHGLCSFRDRDLQVSRPRLQPHPVLLGEASSTDLLE